MRRGAGASRRSRSTAAAWHTLCRLKPGQRAAAAQQFVREALAPETEIAVRSVEYVPGADGEAVVRVALAVGETETELSVKVWKGGYWQK